ncbi:hypothetical protein [Bosea vestrisii]|uniref:Uncharacterized protein n=1 Tax=Bosea vestrisii TaxID=151416 RepID=A0ABW0HAU2_9HYPH
MRSLKYTGPVDTLEIYDLQDPNKVIFSEHLHPNRTYELPEGDHQVVTNMVNRGLFVPPPEEKAASPGADTSRGEPAPATVPATPPEKDGKAKRS